MYAYLLPFQHDMNIILLPYKKKIQKSQKTYYYQWRKYQKMPKMDVTAIMEKTVKNTGGVAALQKMTKNYEKDWRDFTSQWLFII